MKERHTKDFMDHQTVLDPIHHRIVILAVVITIKLMYIYHLMNNRAKQMPLILLMNSLKNT